MSTTTTGDPDVSINADQTNESRHNQYDTVSGVAVKMPVFSSNNPALFFRRADAQFALRNITSEETKYLHVFTVIPDDIAELLVTEPTSPKAYTTLRDEVLSICDRTRHTKLAAAFADLQVSDERPSIILRRVRRIFTDAGVPASDEMVIHKLIQALPPVLSDLLHAHTTQPVDAFIAIADTVWAARSVSKPVYATSTAEVATVRTGNEARSRQPTTPFQVRPFHPDQRPVVCRAHLYYGTNARTCRIWCQFPSETPRISRNTRTPRQSRDNSPENSRAAATDRPSRQLRD